MPHDLDKLAKLATSLDVRERLHALHLMREGIEDGERPEDVLELARPLVGDPDNDCRWQALIVIGESVRSSPEAVWQVVCEHGVSVDEDMRTGVATVLLEHLLEHHFDAYFPLLKARIHAGNIMLADTLGRCWTFAEALPRWGEVEALLTRRDQR